MRKNQTEHLMKTNPNKANYKTEDRRQNTEDSITGRSLGEDGKIKDGRQAIITRTRRAQGTQN